MIEATNGNDRREEALQLLSTLLPRKGSRLDTVGSYRLGIHSPQSDIDAVFLGNMGRKEFYLHIKRQAASSADIRLKKVPEDNFVNPRS